MGRRELVLGAMLVFSFGAAAQLQIELQDVAPSQLVARGSASQPMLLSNAQVFLQCMPSQVQWSADSTQLQLRLSADGLQMRADGSELAWQEGEHRFAAAMHVRSEGLTLVARAGRLRIDGQRASLGPAGSLKGAQALRGRRGWLASAVIGLMVALLYFYGRSMRKRSSQAAPSPRRRRGPS